MERDEFTQWREWAKTAPIIEVIALIEVLQDEIKKRMDAEKRSAPSAITGRTLTRDNNICGYCGMAFGSGEKHGMDCPNALFVIQSTRNKRLYWCKGWGWGMKKADAFTLEEKLAFELPKHGKWIVL